MVRLTACAILASLGAASAFVPVTPRFGSAVARARTSSPRMAVSDMLGIDVETGGLFDPLGFSKDEASLYKYREVELKHGRVAMLAIVGTLVQTFYHLPDAVFSNPRPLAALAQVYAERPVAFWQIFLFLGAIDISVGRQDYVNKAPGDLGFGEAFKPTDANEFAKLQLKELKNGRLAQIAIIGQFLQEYRTGEGPIEQLLNGHYSLF